MPYRRRKQGPEIWHWCLDCTDWPTSDYQEKVDKATTGELCVQCQTKDKYGDCKREGG